MESTELNPIEPEDTGRPTPVPDAAPDEPVTAEEEAEAADALLADALQAEQAVAADVSELDRLVAERDEYRDALQRLQADFENYRKRVIRQQTEHLERAAEALVEKLLDALDTFDLALAHGEGLEQGHKALMAVLDKEGLERVGEVGEEFDPTRHDAVAHQEADEADEADEAGPRVAEVLRAGYRWKGRVLRPAMVKVQG